MAIHDTFDCHKCLKEPLVKCKGLFLLCPQCKAWRLSSKGYLIVGGCIGLFTALLGVTWSINHHYSVYRYIHGLYLILVGIASANAPCFMAEACKKSDRFGSAVIRAGRMILLVEIAFVGLGLLFLLV